MIVIGKSTGALVATRLARTYTESRENGKEIGEGRNSLGKGERKERKEVRKRNKDGERERNVM